MKTTFAGLYGAVPGDITEDEYAQAEVLVTEKFGTHEWLTRVP
jgi:lipoate-protein ligase A